MQTPHYILAIDQGTTSSRAILFSLEGKLCAVDQHPYQQHYPQEGWVEHDPEDIWQTTLKACHNVIKKLNITPSNIATIGISNQRETTLLWHKDIGKAIYPAIVWQDRRTAHFCQQHAAQQNDIIQEKTGLLLDPYFSATKIRWLLENVAGTRELAKQHKLAFGTIDSFLLWRLTGGKVHATDVTNASRTLLFNINSLTWDDELLEFFDIPKNLLPEVKASDAYFGETAAAVFGSTIPITGIAGDQQAALVGNACIQPGMMKGTYGTGAFLMLNIGNKPIYSSNHLLTTVGYQVKGRTHYAIEGSIFNAGTTVKWLQEQLSIINSPAETEQLANQVVGNNSVYFVPTFTGVGAPYWNANAQGAIVGLTRDTSIAQIARAALEATAYRTLDLLNAICRDYHGSIEILRVDGGMCANRWFLQCLANMLQLEVSRANCLESSALGAACLAGVGIGIYLSLEDTCQFCESIENFHAQMPLEQRNQLYTGWQQAIERIVSN